MAKKRSVSSRPGKQIGVSAESIWSKPLNESQKAALEGVRKEARTDETVPDCSSPGCNSPLMGLR